MTASPAGVVPPVSRRITTEAFYRAIVAAGRAPSAYNSRPWRWQVSDGALDLFLDARPLSEFADPGGRMATISCGAALHHARLTLAARGWRVTTTRRPDAGVPAPHARLRIDGPAPVSPDTADLARVIRLRHTDLRPVTGRPINPVDLRAIRAAFESQHVRAAVLRPDQILALTVATADGGGEPSDTQWHTQLALWSGSARIVGAPTGLRRPIASGKYDRAATFVVLHGPGDQEMDWLHTGEALSAASLVATRLGVSILPFSAPIEHDRARDTLRDAVPDLGHPYLMMRLGRHVTVSTPAGRTARRFGATSRHVVHVAAGPGVV
jgi:nitroreductase